MIIGCSVLIGWFIKNDFLRTLITGQVSMKFNAALCFVLSSIVLLINCFGDKNRKKQIVSVSLSVIIVLIGLLTLAEFMFGLNIGIDEFFVKDERITAAGYFAGRMSPLTSINFIFIGTGLLLLNREKTAAYQFFYLSGIAFISLLMLIGFNFITAIPTYFYLAVHTAIGFIILAAGIWFVQPALQKKIRFERKLFTGFAAVILLIMALSVLSSYYSNKRISTSGMVKHTNSVLSEVQLVLSLSKDIESGERSYIIAHDSSYLKYFLIAKKNLFNHIKKLKALTADNSSQQLRIDSLRYVVEKRIAFSERMISLRNKQGFAEANGLMFTQQGILYTVAIRELAAIIEKEENDLLVKRQNENNNSIASFNRAFMVFLAVVFLLLISILFWIRNYIAIGKKAAHVLSKQNEELEKKVKERVAEIKKNENRFRAIIENNFDMITLLDKDFKIFYRSPSAIRIMGWTNEEQIGADGMQNIHTDDREKTITIIREIMESPGKSACVLFRNRHKKGHYLWVEGTIINLLNDENIKAFVFNYRDITARVEAEEKLIASEERFRSIIEQYPSPVVRYAPDGSYIGANPAWEIMWKDKLENIIGYNIRKDPQMAASGMLKVIERTFAGETVMTDILEYDPALIGKTGRKRWIQLLMYPLKNNEGKILEVILITLDMTDNKVAEEKLIESEKKYRYLFQNNPMPMWIIDLNTFKFLDVNEMAILQYGYSRQEFLSMTAMNIRPEEDTVRFIESDHSFKTNNANYNKGVWRHRKKDGTIISVEIIAHEILFEGAEARFVLANDVTDQKKAEEKIIASEKQFRNTLDNMLEGAQIIGFDWRYIYINDSLAKHAKYKREEMIGFTVMEKFPGIEETDIFKVYKRCFEERISIHLENEFKFPDGSIGWFELSFQPIPQGIFILSIDITERKMAEEKLIKSEKIYKTIASSIPGSVICLLDREFRYLLIEGDMLENLGYSKVKLLGNKAEDVLAPDVFAGVKKDLQNVLNGEIVTRETSRSGYDTISRFIPLKDDNNFVYAIMTVAIDVTELKNAQRDIIELNHSLEEKIIERTSQLKKTNEELEAFTYSVSHDLRAPLRAIIGFSAILQQDYIAKLDDEAKRLTTIIVNNTKKMGQLIDDLLTFSRMGRQEVVKTNIETNEMIKEIITEIDKRDVNAKKINWQIHDLPQVMGDLNIMRQVWINLISNAAKYSEKTSIQKIEIGSFKQDGEIVFFVKDNGVGFDEKYKNKLFRVFQRLHSADEFDGTGIGLAIVEKIISKHGGKVWAEGEKNKGACFYFSLPAA